MSRSHDVPENHHRSAVRRAEVVPTDRLQADVATRLRAVAVGIIDRSGPSGLTVRALASAASYSASAVSYHTKPFSKFLDQVWVDVEMQLLSAGSPSVSSHDRARSMIEWAGSHPARLDFLIHHLPSSDVARPAGSIERYVSRRLHAALERAAALGDAQEALDWLAATLDDVEFTERRGTSASGG